MKNRLRISIYLLIISLTLTQQLFGQGETNRWYFGRRAGFDFSTTPPTMLSNSPYAGGGDVEEAHATISDAAGNYLFYTNGQTVWTNTGAAMPNGSGLNGHWSTTQCATVFPVPGSTTDYYILTTPLTGSATELQWNRVDMSLNGGLGDIKTPVASNKNQPMPSCPTYMMESVVSVPHFNGTDIWVIAHTADDPGTALPTNEGGSFIVWLVTSAGITYSNTYTLGYAYPQGAGTSRGIGIMKSNSCFNRIFISYYNASSRVEGFSFSNSTGVVSNWPAPISGPLVIDQYRNTSNVLTAMTSFSYGLEISGNGRYLYNTISGETGDKVLTQYDLQAGTGTNADINNSATRLSPAVPDGVRYGQLQLGPDGKIYHTLHNWNNIGFSGYCKIGVINAPNTGGVGANFVEAAYVWPLSATGVGSTMGLPSFHKGFVAGRPIITSSVSNLQEVCLGDAVDFTAVSAGTPVTSYQWNIDKNLNATIEYSGAALSSITHTYASTGNYIVELAIVDQCGYTYRSESPVVVLPKPITTGTATCGNPIGLNVTSLPTTGKSYVWYSDAAGTTPIASGASATIPAPYTGNVYVRQESTVTVTPTVSIPAQPAATNSISAIQTTLPASTFDPATTRITTLSILRPLTLNSLVFITNGQWGAGTGNFTVNVRNSGGTIIHTTTVSGSVDLNSPTITINGNARCRFTYAPGGGLALIAGNYTVEITRLSGPIGAMQIGQFNFPALTASSIPTAISNSGNTNGTTTTFITDINVSTPAVPAVMIDVITSTPLICSNMSTAISANCPLPVTWLSFTAERIENSSSVQLDWITSSEENSKLFNIQRSIDGITFETIGQLDANGNSDKFISYRFIDKNAPNGTVYYRINEVDFDNRSLFSEIRTVNGSGEININLVPNPSHGNFRIIGFDENTSISVFIYAYTGQLVYSAANISANEIINISHLPKGMFLVKVVNDQSIKTTQLVNQ